MHTCRGVDTLPSTCFNVHTGRFPFTLILAEKLAFLKSISQRTIPFKTISQGYVCAELTISEIQGVFKRGWVVYISEGLVYETIYVQYYVSCTCTSLHHT